MLEHKEVRVCPRTLVFVSFGSVILISTMQVFYLGFVLVHDTRGDLSTIIPESKLSELDISLPTLEVELGVGLLVSEVSLSVPSLEYTCEADTVTSGILGMILWESATLLLLSS